MKKPNFFIVGAAKCGTTALSQYLGEHPSIYISEPKEPHHFSDDLVTANKMHWTDKEYIDACFFGATPMHKAVGDASVFYLYSNNAIKNIMQYNPDAKIIAMFRHPVDAAYSLHQQFYFAGWEDVSSFNEAWDMQMQRRKGSGIPRRFPVDPCFLQYEDIYKYGDQVDRLLEFVPANNFMPIIYDDFKRDVAGVYRSVLEFIDIDFDDRINFDKINASRKISSAFIGNALRSRTVSMGASFVKKILGVKSFGIGRPQSPIDIELRGDLTQIYSEDIRKLSKLIDRDLGFWLK